MSNLTKAHEAAVEKCTALADAWLAQKIEAERAAAKRDELQTELHAAKQVVVTTGQAIIDDALERARTR